MNTIQKKKKASRPILYSGFNSDPKAILSQASTARKARLNGLTKLNSFIQQIYNQDFKIS